MTPKARRIFKEAFDTLDRTADIPTPDIDPEIDEYIESCLEPDWEPPAPRVRKRRDTPVAIVQQQAGEEWNEWMDKRLADALERFSDHYSQTLIDVVFTRMNKMKKASDDQIKELRTEIAALREFIKGDTRILHSGLPPKTLDIN